jgi:integrase/recombinase XerD
MGYVISAPYDGIYESFLDHQRPRTSAQGYRKLADITKRVIRWFEAEELLPEVVTIADAVRYGSYLSTLTTRDGNTITTGTMINYLKAARCLFEYLVESERVRTNPFAELRYPKGPEHLSRNVLTEAQMGCLLVHLAHFDEAASALERLRRYRVHVIAEFLYASGLRIAEAASLVEANLDLASRLVYVPEGKGGKARTAFLTGYASDVMARYLSRGREAVLGKYKRLHGDTLFCADKARLAAVVNEELREVCESLAIPVITTHGFRHSLGTHLLRAGCDMRHIQAILGHESLNTTQIYTKVDKDDLKRSLDAFHPRQWQHEKEYKEAHV